MARVLGLDIGERRIGVAVSDPTGTVARPLATLVRTSRQSDFQTIRRLIEEHAADRVVVGLPLSLNGSEGPQARQTRRYAQHLAEAVPVPVEFWDERYSTATAAEILIGTKRRRPSAQSSVDAVAAAVLLQSYLNAAASVKESQSLTRREY
jgi:putative Holliday junction resolvase